MNAPMPGPYVALNKRVSERMRGFEVCTVAKTDAQHHPVLVALVIDQPTADLFAASLDLLAALERVGCQDEGSCPNTPDGDCFVCAAIRKARGGK